MSAIGSYTRLEYENTPIYINPDFPDWFVPNSRADHILRYLISGHSVDEACGHFSKNSRGASHRVRHDIESLVNRLRDGCGEPYQGRGRYHTLKGLKECWIHITNKCNMACSHCMFSSSGRSDEISLDRSVVLTAIDQAIALGATVVYFTGGEPFVYPDFTGICDHILMNENTHVVILTNGRDLSAHESWLRSVPPGRVHFQVSIDGSRQNHEKIRGKGTFGEVLESIGFLRAMGFPVTISMAVTEDTVGDMETMVEIAHQSGVQSIHFMWLFARGRAGEGLTVPVALLLDNLIAAYERAKRSDIVIDNMEVIKSQLFTIPGTRHDLSNAAWQSLAIAPTGDIYPSPALIGIESMGAGLLKDGIEKVWRTSAVFGQIREASVGFCDRLGGDPLKYLIGGGDVDHSIHAGGSPVGHDPYMKLYNGIALYLIAEIAREYNSGTRPGFLCRMGEYVYECTEESGPVNFTHSNCVQSISGADGHGLVKQFYSSAAEEVNEDIVNPVGYREEEIDHIPLGSRVRSYGCGSPVLECDLQEGETLVDLGSGTGVECFIGAKKIGPSGKVYGIDMADPMLERAEKARVEVAQKLGYDIVEFKKGFLEKLPLPKNSADCIISNCVINLTADKRKTFQEIMRILKPGARICISDIVCDRDIPLDMKYNAKLRGECIGGAMKQNELFAMLEELGFEQLYVNKRYLYRKIESLPFFAVTYTAYKPALEKRTKTLMYRGPLHSVSLDNGAGLRRGVTTTIEVPASFTPDETSFFQFDSEGNVENVVQHTSCGVFIAPDREVSQISKNSTGHYSSGCFVCGKKLVYSSENQTRTCYFCRKELRSNAECIEGHFVCDSCHSADARGIIRTMCTGAPENDMIALFNRIREHASIPVHGPEHHGLIPGVILAAYRNGGGHIVDNEIITGIERGSSIAGGACAFLGVCGAASGIGTAFSIILKGTPYKGEVRQIVQKVTAQVLHKIAAYDAPRCCKRDGYLALTAAVELSEKYLPQKLQAGNSPWCTQYKENKECIGKRCPLWKNVDNG
ncbi:MAG: methyltransferase domain-containing protein [Chitinivibrionales bacterium]|nr:methyltransferase domain-containing protein [Chitinivibrionales bacterium]